MTGYRPDGWGVPSGLCDVLEPRADKHALRPSRAAPPVYRPPAMASIVHSVVRSASFAVAVSIVSLGALWVWSSNREARLREEIHAMEAKMAAEIKARDAMIERLERSHRKARIEVVGQRVGPEGYESPRDGTRIVSTDVRFIELDDAGRELGRREFTIPGDVLFVDAWTARFPKESVAEGNPLRDRTVVLFRRIYSEQLPPVQGFPIDTPGGIPCGYAGSERMRLEQAVWQGFWKIAADPGVAREHGIAVAQGEAVYKPVRQGEAYELMVDAAAGLTLVPAERTRSADASERP